MQKGNWIMFLIGTVGVVLGVVLREPIIELFKGKVAPKPPAINLPPSPERVARPHLDQADRDCERFISEHLKVLDDFFVDAKKNVPVFAEDVLSYRSQWYLLKDHLPLTRGGEQDRFIRNSFEKHLFSVDRLAKGVETVVSSYLQQMRSVEGKMLVAIRMDVSGFPETFLLASADQAGLETLFGEAVAQAKAQSKIEAGSDLSQEAISAIVGEVLTMVAIRLGVSGGIIGTATASAPVTLGVGLIVGLIIDQIVSWVWDWWADPRGELEKKLEKKLDEMHHLIRDGSENGPGLRLRLEQYARERAVVRRAAVLDVLARRPEGAK
jgi:hypothetical protein